jgi:hypothetical protein
MRGHVYPFDTVEEKPSKGPSTYLHAGAGIGWPVDHSTDDTFALPPLPLSALLPPNMLSDAKRPEPLNIVDDRPEYKAEFSADGSANLVLYTPCKIIAKFQTFVDAQTAAQALNNLKGY